MALFLRDDGTFAAATIGGTVSVSQGGTGATTLTAHGVLLGESIGAIAATAAMSNGQILVGQTGADPTPQTVGGDATLSNAGSLVVTKTNNVSFAASATTDTTNAANISTGTLPAARLPAPTATTLGGVKSLAAVTHQFLTQIGTDGSVAQAQPAAADVSGLAASATTDTTNASNISSGTLGVAQGGTARNTLSANGILIGEGVAGVNSMGAGTAGQVVKSAGAGVDPAFQDDLATISYVIGDGVNAVTTGLKGYLEIPFACTILRSTLLADASGSAVVDVFKTTFAAFDASATHPVAADKITASAPPTISTATKAQDSTLTGWTTAITSGDILAFNVNSATTVKRLTLSLKVRKG